MAEIAIPSPRDDDDEDVHWALSTAVTLWGRGERAEALKWLKRAAEQASDADKDIRSLELFKAAADLQPLAAAAPAPAPAPAPSVAPPAQPSAPAAAQSRMPPPPLPTNRPPPPGVRPPQPSLPPATQASPAIGQPPPPLRSAPPPAPRASARPPAPAPGQTPAPTSVAPPPRTPSMPPGPASRAIASAPSVPPAAATPAPPPVAMPTRKRLPSRTGARKSVAGDPLARTGKNPVAPAGAPQGGAAKAGGSGKRPKTTIIDQGWGDFTPTPAPLPAPPPPPDEEITAARNRAALMDMPIDDLDGVTNIFSGRDIAKQVASVRRESPASQQPLAVAPVTITGMPAPSAPQQAPAATPTPAPVATQPQPPASHTPAPSAVQPQLSRNKVGPASVRPAALPVTISHQAPASHAPASHAPAAHAPPSAQAHAHTPAPSQVHTPQPVPSQPVAPAQAPAAAPSAAARVATVSAIRVAIFGREGDMRILALAPQSSAPAGTVQALLVPTSDAEAAALAKLFGL